MLTSRSTYFSLEALSTVMKNALGLSNRGSVEGIVDELSRVLVVEG